LDEACESGVNLVFVARLQSLDLYRLNAGGFLYASGGALGKLITQPGKPYDPARLRGKPGCERIPNGTETETSEYRSG
jgi:hypothetical protein